MRKIVGFAVLLAFCLYPYLVRTSTSPPVPDISGWTVVNVSRIELRVSKDVVAYLGLGIEYLNPANPGEFMRVISGHIPLIISKRKPNNERLSSEAALLFYSQKEENDRLAESSKKSDPIIYVRWRTKKNPRNGNDMQDGDVNIWLLQSDGSWRSFTNEMINVELLSENISNDPDRPQNIFTGMKYRIGDAYRILRVNRDDLLQLFKKEGK